MAPGPKEEWLELAERIQAALAGQPSLFPDPRVDEAVARVREQQTKAGAEPKAPSTRQTIPAVVPVRTDGVQTQDSREVGPLHVGHQLWQRLQMTAILKAAGLAASAIKLTEVMTLNRLVHPDSERAMVDWARRVAQPDQQRAHRRHQQPHPGRHRQGQRLPESPEPHLHRLPHRQQTRPQ